MEILKGKSKKDVEELDFKFDLNVEENNIEKKIKTNNFEQIVSLGIY